jgi:diguanylate cyclase (GGDEF)-like protein
MKISLEGDAVFEYPGRILKGNYGNAIRGLVSERIKAIIRLEELGLPFMPYLSAWKRGDQVIWYEYAGREFIQFMGVEPEDLAATFRRYMLDRRIYTFSEEDAKAIEEHAPIKYALGGTRENIREQIVQAGNLEALYKIGLIGRGNFWLKDMARVEIFKQDDICLSMGYLTDVTREMEEKELLAKLGYYDPLTLLPTKTILDKVLEIHMRQFKQKKIRDFCFFIINIDNYQTINQKYGYAGGNFILKNLAAILMSAKDKKDEIGRFGKEEFYGISFRNRKKTKDFLEKLRLALEKKTFRYNKIRLSSTVSAGLVSAAEEDKLNLYSFIDKAEQRLLTAKMEGGNRVIADN